MSNILFEGTGIRRQATGVGVRNQESGIRIPDPGNLTPNAAGIRIPDSGNLTPNSGILNPDAGLLSVAGLVNDSITDGPGLRMTIFMQGCLRDCHRCHNPKAQPLAGGTCYSAEQLLRKVLRNPLLSGVTFSGGEPLLQAAALIPLARLIRREGLSLALYTGFTFEEILAEGSDKLLLFSLCDTVIDGPYIDEARSLALPFRGSSNQRVLNAPLSLKARAPVWESRDGWGYMDTAVCL